MGRQQKKGVLERRADGDQQPLTGGLEWGGRGGRGGGGEEGEEGGGGRVDCNSNQRKRRP